MNPRTPSVGTILSEAVEIANPAERQLFVEKCCAGDAALVRRVERLVADHFRAGSFPGTWQGSVMAGFFVGFVLMEIVGLASFDPQDLEDMRKLDGAWLRLFTLFVAWPFLIGAFCAGIGLAVWIIRRVFWRWIP